MAKQRNSGASELGGFVPLVRGNPLPVALIAAAFGWLFVKIRGAHNRTVGEPTSNAPFDFRGPDFNLSANDEDPA